MEDEIAPSSARTRSCWSPRPGAQCLAGLAVGGCERHYIVAAQRRDDPLEHRLHAQTLTDLTGDFVLEPIVRPPIHRLQRLADALIRNDVEEW